MTSPDLVQNARKAFYEDTKDTRYFSLLPPETKPPVDMNKAAMDQFGPQLSKTYLEAAPRYK